MRRGESSRSSGLSLVERVAGTLLGIAIFGSGVAAVFTTDNGTGAAALLAIGAACCAFAVFGDRVESFGVSGVTITIRDIAREAFALSEQADRQGNDKAAQALARLGVKLQDLALAYRRVRGSMLPSKRRTDALQQVVNEAHLLSQAADLNLEANDVRLWFDQGTSEARITALALMQGNPSLRNFEAALEAIERPRELFEQYQGLKLAEAMVNEDQLSTAQQLILTAVLERALRQFRLVASPLVLLDPERRRVGKSILSALNTRS